MLLLCACIVSAAQQTWFLQTQDGKWHSFSSRAAWERSAKENMPLEIAIANRSEAGISLEHDVQGESGDWKTVDLYEADMDGLVQTLRRTFVSVEQDIKIVSVYKKTQKGTLRRTSVVRTSLSGLNVKRNEEPDVPQLPIARNIFEFEFMRNGGYRSK